MNLSLAPTWRHAAVRTLTLCVAVVVVAGAVYLVIGRPSPMRLVRQNEIARFAPAVGHGLVQFLGETGLVVLAAVIGRRVLKIRL